MRQVDKLKISIRAEREWLQYLRETGVDTSKYPRVAIFIPELGITHHQVCFPDALKPQFEQWFNRVFTPRLSSEKAK